MARAARYQGKANFSGNTGIEIIHVYAGGFVAHMDDFYMGIEQRIVDRHNMIARQRKNSFDLEAFQGLRNNVGASDACYGHGGFDSSVSKVSPGLTRRNSTGLREI